MSQHKCMPNSTESSSSQLGKMNSVQTQDQKHPSKFHNNKRLNQDQVMLLERSFTVHKKLDPELKLKLANQLGVPPRQVAIWYQNKRARWKTQNLELDYNTVQVKLENALAEKRRLEKDVKQLKEELNHAQEILFANLTQRNYPFSSRDSSNNGSCSENIDGDNHHHHHHHYLQAMEVDELYGCMIGGGCRSAWD
ncbi:homeobox-leucine zipper protein ATHB-52 [Mangifera indica]|uniref:homeobox-leucine zipper protein ATHB-52 n=1 Tax=Mangifera indica TaxID=29780 RepID=UPI001CFBFD65|nr:homeobox-leucine zipper protein ATHB-52 [Mangifera indica]